jgi:hypothetical protein
MNRQEDRIGAFPLRVGTEQPDTSAAEPVAEEVPEEVLVPDPRARLTPSDLVDRKLAYALHGASLGVSQLWHAVPGTRGCMTSHLLPTGFTVASPAGRSNGMSPQT